jgi:hypothetical protein
VTGAVVVLNVRDSKVLGSNLMLMIFAEVESEKGRGRLPCAVRPDVLGREVEVKYWRSLRELFLKVCSRRPNTKGSEKFRTPEIQSPNP